VVARRWTPSSSEHDVERTRPTEREIEFKSIPDKVASRLAASVVATASVDVFASAVASVLAVGAILDTEAEGGVFSIACITLPILHFFSPSAFFVAEGSCFF
jgi:glucokinase